MTDIGRKRWRAVESEESSYRSAQRRLGQSRRAAPFSAKAEYDGASYGRRAASWRRSGRDANSELNAAVMFALRGVAREMVRNNPHAASGKKKWADYLVGSGFSYQVFRGEVVDKTLTALARKHFDSTSCDPLGQHNLHGLVYQVAASMVEGGGGLMRRRWRRASDGLPVPFQLQALEPDYINMQLTGPNATGGARIQGIELDAIGRRAGYWLYSGHPGAVLPGGLDTKLIPATEIAYCYRADRPEALHGGTWFAPVIARIKDFGEYEDAQLVRQKIAACFTVFRVDGDDYNGQEPTTDSNGDELELGDELTAVEPGIIERLGPGEDVKFATPPGVDGYEPYSSVTLHAVAAGLGLPYEELTGDFSQVSFISGRLGRMALKAGVEAVQWNIIVPQLLDRIGGWFLEACEFAGKDVTGCEVRWTPPRFPMASPETEVPANRDAVRAGQKTPSQVIRENGDDPETFFDEFAADFAKIDALGLILDCDPRRVTQVGNAVQMTPAQMDRKGA